MTNYIQDGIDKAHKTGVVGFITTTDSIEEVSELIIDDKGLFISGPMEKDNRANGKRKTIVIGAGVLDFPNLPSSCKRCGIESNIDKMIDIANFASSMFVCVDCARLIK